MNSQVIKLRDPVLMCEICWAQRVTEPAEDDCREPASMRLVEIVPSSQCPYCQLKRLLANTGLERYL